MVVYVWAQRGTTGRVSAVRPTAANSILDFFENLMDLEIPVSLAEWLLLKVHHHMR